MSDDNKKLNKNNLYKLIFCAIILFLLSSPTMNFSHVNSFILKFIEPDLANYPYQSPPIFFSIGEALASISILLAIYQFKKDEWRIVLGIKKYIIWIVASCITSGVILSFSSVFILFKNPVNIFQLSIFWQVMASILIAFSIIFLFLKATTKKLFNKQSAKRFYRILHWELSRPTQERLDVVLNILLDNLDSICKSAAQSPKSEETQSAVAILDVILSEDSLVNVITTKRFDALYYILTMVEKYDLQYQQAEGISRIVKSLFVNQNSFLYKHFESSGLALSANLYEKLFGSPKMLSNFDLFGWPTFDYTMRSNLNALQVEVFIKALSKSIETYLKTGEVPPRHINNGLAHLSEIFGDLCIKIKTEEDRGMDTNYILKDEWWSLHIIANFLGHDYPFLAYQDTLNQAIIEQEKTATEVNFHSDITINAGIANVLYNAFEQLSRMEKSNDIYHIILELLSGMVYEEQYKEGYRTPFEKRMWKQIGNNIIKKQYPAALKTYLIYVGFSLASKDLREGAGFNSSQTERMRRLLYIDLKPLLDIQEKMINGTKMEDALLPDCMKYEGGKFTYTMGFGRGPTVNIAEPPVGSNSALEETDLEID